MPFIDSKITVKVSDEKKEVLKAKIGKAVSIIGKPESFLMVGFEDEYIVAETNNGYSIKVKTEEIPVQGKGAGGVQLISLRRGDYVVSAISADNSAEFNGIQLSNMKAVKRGGKGNKK